MFGWLRKRNEGFEWREYVRTTVLARRERRRQQLEEAKDVAVEKVIDAGRAGVAAGKAGVSAAKEGLVVGAGVAKTGILAGAAAAASGLAAAWDWFLRFIAARLAAAALTGIQAAEPAFGILRQPGVATPLAIVAVVAAIATLTRIPFQGFDWEAIVALVIAATAAILFALPKLAANERVLPVVTMPRSASDLLPDREQWKQVAAVAGTVVTVAVLGITAWLAVYSGPLQQNVATAVPSSPAAPASSNHLSGRAVALSGDRLRVAGTTLRLSGIEAPESDQPCARTGSRGYNCSQAAKDALARLVRNHTVTCDITGRDADNRAEGHCEAGGTDLAADLVKNGQVFAIQGFLSRYGSLEYEARTASLGVWRGNSDRPSDFRAKRWEEAARTAPDGCPIKGQLTGDGRVYVLPWSPNYERVKVRDEKGERWFCSESEARAAGWKPVERS